MKKYHLRDLFVRGRLVTIEDDSRPYAPDEEVLSATVFVKKLNTAENEEAVRLGNAARARIITAKSHPDSNEYRAAEAEVAAMSHDDMIGNLIAEDLSKARDAIEAELAEEPEWNDDDYLQGLHDLWNKGLSDVWVKAQTATEDEERDPQADEAESVYAKLVEFRDLVDKKAEDTAKSLRRDWEDVSDEELRSKNFDRHLAVLGSMAWLDEYRKAEIFLAVRDPEDHREQYFADIRDLDELEMPVVLELMKAMRNLSVDPQEGKDLQETLSS